MDDAEDTGTSSPSFSCAFYNPQDCDPAVTACPQREFCRHHYGMTTACYVVWSNDTSNGVKIRNKGCWLAQNQKPNSCDHDECIADKPTSRTSFKSGHDTYFCCCNKPRCNERFELSYVPETSGTNKEVPRIGHASMDMVAVISYVVIPLIVLSVVCVVGYYLYRLCKMRKEGKRHVSNEELQEPASPSFSEKSLEFIDIIARGRYGSVWKARANGSIVAVKVFPPQEFESYTREKEIYMIPGLVEHRNILRYLGSNIHGSGDKAEYFLATAYQENGSLHDYLKAHKLTLSEFLHISTGMLRGLAFLHEDQADSNGNMIKPAIVHRDFKSRNVLLDRDLTACVSDFGLAMKCPNGRMPNEVHSQVGTRRYMSPEVLEGATGLTAAAFRETDVYAAGLVLWELLSRCSFAGEPVDDYKLPFEDVGPKPTIEQLQKHVAKEKRRPHLKKLWEDHPHGRVICSTIQEMWDPESDARLSAGCALERLKALQDSNVPAVVSTITENETKVKPEAEHSPLLSRQ